MGQITLLNPSFHDTFSLISSHVLTQNAIIFHVISRFFLLSNLKCFDAQQIIKCLKTAFIFQQTFTPTKTSRFIKPFVKFPLFYSFLMFLQQLHSKKYHRKLT